MTVHMHPTVKFLLVLAAVVLFVLTAVFFFWVSSITLKTDFGLVTAGLAAFAASTFPSTP